MYLRTFLFTALAGIFLSTPSEAGIIDYSTSAAQVFDQFDGNFASCGLGVLTCSGFAASITITTNPVISLSASSPTHPDDPQESIGAGGWIEWSVDILGGNPGDEVDLDVRYVMSSFGPSNDSGADISFNGVTLDTVCDGDCGPTISNFVEGTKIVQGMAGGSNVFREAVSANDGTVTFADPKYFHRSGFRS